MKSSSNNDTCVNLSPRENDSRSNIFRFFEDGYVTPSLSITMLALSDQQLFSPDFINQVSVAEILKQVSLLTESSCYFIFGIDHKPFYEGENLIFVMKDIRQLRIDMRVSRTRTLYTA